MRNTAEDFPVKRMWRIPEGGRDKHSGSSDRKFHTLKKLESSGRTSQTLHNLVLWQTEQSALLNGS